MNTGSGIPFDALVQPLIWSGILMVVALVVDSLGRRKGEPEPPPLPKLHDQIERALRDRGPLSAGAKAAGPQKRI